MKIRKTTPEKDNKYYTRKSAGGVSPCILGKNPPWKGSTLRNCVGASEGRYNEIAGGAWQYFKGEYPHDVISWAKKHGLAVQMDPAPGAMAVWYSADHKHEHLASCEVKEDNNTIYIWESGWNFETKDSQYKKVTRAGNWGRSDKYPFKGFIWHPDVDPYKCTDKVIKPGERGESVKYLQWALNRAGCYEKGANNRIDGHFGPATKKALGAFQKLYNLKVDYIAGPKTQSVINNLYTLE